MSLEEPSPAEKRLIAAAATGEPEAFGADERLDARLIVALICEEPLPGNAVPETLHPSGLTIIGGRVDGLLDARGRVLKARLYIRDAKLPGGADFADAETKRLDFDGSEIRGLHLVGAHVAGQLALVGETTKLTARPFSDVDSREFALMAQGARIDDGIFLNNAHVSGCCDINSAEFGGPFAAEGATFENRGGNAINAQGARIDGGIFLNNAHVSGCCDINSAEFGGPFSAEGATFENPGGNAIQAQGAKIQGGVYLRALAKARGRLDFLRVETTYFHMTAADGAVAGVLDFESADIRHCDLSEAALAADGANWEGVALDLTNAQIGRLMLSKAPIQGRAIFCQAHVEHFDDHKTGWPPENADENRRWDLVGLTYDHLVRPNGTDTGGDAAAARLRWLSGQGPQPDGDEFKPQPYEALADAFKRAGLEPAARRIRAERRRKLKNHWFERGFDAAVHGLYKFTSDSGNSPGRITVWFLGFYALFVYIFWLCWENGGLAMPSGETAPPEGWHLLSLLVGYVADIYLLVFRLGFRDAFITTSTPCGLFANLVGGATALTGTILNAILIVTFTGLTRSE